MDSNETITPAEETPGGNGELSHSDKMIGVFTEPAKMFYHTSKFPTRNKDWVIPVLILFLVAGLIQRLALMNEEVYFKVMQEQSQELDKQVDSGQLSSEEADQRLDAIETFTKGPIGWVTTIVGALIGGLIFFLLLSLFYFLSSKFLLKGEGGYSSALVAGGLSSYISLLQVIIAGILTISLGLRISDFSVASLWEMDRLTLSGWLLAKINPISIWYYIVLSIGLAKMFKSDNVKKYYALVFVSWIISSLIFFVLAQNISFFKNLI